MDRRSSLFLCASAKNSKNAPGSLTHKNYNGQQQTHHFKITPHLSRQLITITICYIIQDAHWKDAKKEQHSTRYAFRLRSDRESSYRL